MYILDVKADLNRRMASYTHSMQPSNDEVTLALLICHIDELEEKISNATNCLVCAAIGDPVEVCKTTLGILEHIPASEKTSKPKSKSVCGGMNACVGSYYDHTTTMCQKCVKDTSNATEVTVEVIDTITVCYWADGTWCNDYEIEEYSYMSDDFARVELANDISDVEIERFVRNVLKLNGSTK